MKPKTITDAGRAAPPRKGRQPMAGAKRGSNAEAYTMHVVSHTHWDREWRYPFQEFRMLLIDMFDLLIELMTKNPDYRHFLLDSQTVPLEDYLEIRPDRRAALEKLVRDGRIHIGPWYCLPDTPPISASQSCATCSSA